MPPTAGSMTPRRGTTATQASVTTSAQAPGQASTSASQWRFLTNHGHVLVHLSRHPESRVRDVAVAVGITERSAQSILADLEAGRYVSKVRHGRRNRYELHPELHFRHPQEAHRQIGELLDIFR